MQYPVAAGAGINGDWRGECRQRRHGPGHQVTRPHVVGNTDPANPGDGKQLDDTRRSRLFNGLRAFYKKGISRSKYLKILQFMT